MARTRSERGLPQLAKRPDSPNYQIKYYDPKQGRGGRYVSTGTRDPVEAAKALAEFIAGYAGDGALSDPAAAAKAAVRAQEVRCDNIEIATLVGAYYEDFAKHQSRGKNVIGAYKAIRAFFQDACLDQLFDAEGVYLLQEYIDWAEDQGRQPATIRSDIDVIKMAITGLAREYPLLLVPRLPPAPAVMGKIVWLSPEEFQRAADACKQEHVRTYAELGVGTGGRARALYDLQWPQVDFKAGTIDLNPPGRPQNSKARPIVPMTPRLYAYLKALREAYPDATHVIEWNGEPIAFSIRRGFAAAIEAAGLDPQVYTPACLRHTCASWMIQGTPEMPGRSLKEVAEFLGHADSRMVEKHYGHLHPDFKQKAAAVLDAVLPVGVTPQFRPKKAAKNKKAPRQEGAEPLITNDKVGGPKRDRTADLHNAIAEEWHTTAIPSLLPGSTPLR